MNCGPTILPMNKVNITGITYAKMGPIYPLQKYLLISANVALIYNNKFIKQIGKV